MDQFGQQPAKRSKRQFEHPVNPVNLNIDVHINISTTLETNETLTQTEQTNVTTTTAMIKKYTLAPANALVVSGLSWVETIHTRNKYTNQTSQTKTTSSSVNSSMPLFTLISSNDIVDKRIKRSGERR